MLGEFIGNKGCVMELSNPSVFMISLMSEMQQKYAPISASDLISCELFAYWGVTRKTASYFSLDRSWVMRTNSEFYEKLVLLSLGQNSEGLFPQMVMVQA